MLLLPCLAMVYFIHTEFLQAQQPDSGRALGLLTRTYRRQDWSLALPIELGCEWFHLVHNLKPVHAHRTPWQILFTIVASAHHAILLWRVQSRVRHKGFSFKKRATSVAHSTVFEFIEWDVAASEQSFFGVGSALGRVDDLSEVGK